MLRWALVLNSHNSPQKEKVAFGTLLWKHSAFHRSSIHTYSDILVFEAPSTYEAGIKALKVVDRLSEPLRAKD
jgi:hypothetical protein